MPKPDDNPTVKVPGKPGLLGLLGLLGLIGLVGVIPAVMSIPAKVVAIGTLLLAPTGTPAPGTSVGTLITNCINNVPVTDITILKGMNPGLSVATLQQIAVAGVCLPAGQIFTGNGTTSSVGTPSNVTLPTDIWSVTPIPVDTCGNALAPVNPLSATGVSPVGVGNLKLQSALRGIGALSSCAVRGG
jgi:hypothetical protein